MPKKVKTKLTQIPMTIPGLSAASEEATSLSRYDDFINAGKNCSEKSGQEATSSSDEKSIESEQSLWGNFVQFAEESRSAKKKNDSQVWIDDDLKIIKSVLPNITQASRDYHRWKYNEMILETYQMAKKRKDTKTMERAATSYAKFNNVNVEDEQSLPYDMIVVQPFTATSDPSVLGIKPIPNIEKVISDMIEKYRAESLDIDDIEYEDADIIYDDYEEVREDETDSPNL